MSNTTLTVLGVLIAGLIGLAALALLGSPDTMETNPVEYQETTENMSTNDSATSPEQNTEVTIRVLIGEREHTVTMFDNPTTEALLAQLPLALPFEDYGGQEKQTQAPESLSTDGAPSKDRGNVNDFIYYTPNNALVFCYTDIGSWPGIVRLGTFDTSIEYIRDLPDGFTVTIERVE